MFKSVARLFSKRLIPFIIANITLDIDTVIRSNGKYLRIRITALGYELVDHFVKIDDLESNPVNEYMNAKEALGTQNQKALKEALK